jgi:hypothetical protein
MAYNPYNTLNEIAWYKDVYERGNEEDKAWASEQVKPYYQELEKQGYNDLSSMMSGMGASQAKQFKDGYANYQSTANTNTNTNKPIIKMGKSTRAAPTANTTTNRNHNTKRNRRS